MQGVSRRAFWDLYLFRDLSDKLFTSEIIELHEKRGQEYELHRSAKQDLNKLGMYLVPPEAVKEEVSSASETSKRNDLERNTRIKPVLKDLGEFILVFLFPLL